MGKPYSMDLRERVAKSYDEGMKPKELAERYQMSRRSVERLMQRRRETGSIEPLYGKPGPQRRLEGHGERLQELVARDPDATLREIRNEMGIRVGISTLWRGLRDLGLTFKKSHPRRGTTAA